MTVVVADDGGEPTTEVVEEVAAIVEDLTETITDVVEELAEVIEEVAENGSAGATVTEDEVDRILEIDRRLAALESRPWPMSPESVVAVAESAATEVVAEVIEEIAASTEPEPAADPDVTIVTPDVPEESTRKRSKLHPRNWW